MSDWSKKFAKKVSDLGKKILHPGGDESTADAPASGSPEVQPSSTEALGSSAAAHTASPNQPPSAVNTSPDNMSEPSPTPRQETRDIGRQQVGKIYAQALLGAAGSPSVADTTLSELGQLVNDVFAKAPQLEALLGSPRVSVDEKIGLLDKALSAQISPELLKFLKVVCQHDRLDCLRAIYREACSLQNREKGVLEVEMVTASAADPALVQNVKEALANKLGAKIDLRTSTDPNLIGGVMVRVGDKVLDASVKSKLKLVRAQAVSAASQRIRSNSQQFAQDA
ncbi:MAG: ATP synthase F1 subunit delta [Planctomycetota bacterium]